MLESVIRDGHLLTRGMIVRHVGAKLWIFVVDQIESKDRIKVRPFELQSIDWNPVLSQSPIEVVELEDALKFKGFEQIPTWLNHFFEFKVKFEDVKVGI